MRSPKIVVMFVFWGISGNLQTFRFDPIFTDKRVHVVRSLLLVIFAIPQRDCLISSEKWFTGFTFLHSLCAACHMEFRSGDKSSGLAALETLISLLYLLFIKPSCASKCEWSHKAGLWLCWQARVNGRQFLCRVLVPSVVLHSPKWTKLLSRLT